MSVHILEEARRCLDCSMPMCQSGCPIHTPIPKVIRTMLDGKAEEAGRILFENNPLSAVCSLICDHENQCEGHCVLGRKNMPLRFSDIEHYLSKSYTQKTAEGPAPRNGMRAAIVGSGPAGLTIAVMLARKGYQVTIFESKDKIGGVLRYGIPEFRLPKAILDDFEYHHLILKDIKVRPNTTIGAAITIEDLLADGYKSIFLGTGAWQPNTLHIPGETLGNVHFGINYLNNPDSYHLGESVNVIGAGNAAMDVARTALRKGVRRVNCFSLRGKVAASKHEYDYALLEGVQFLFYKKPVKIVDEGAVFEDVVEYKDGTYESVPGSRRLYEADSTIISISQGPRSRLVNLTQGLQGNQRGLLAVDEYGRTTREGVFAASDMAASASTVVQAVAQAKRVAAVMDAYMQGKKIDKTLLR